MLLAQAYSLHLGLLEGRKTVENTAYVPYSGSLGQWPLFIEKNFFKSLCRVASNRTAKRMLGAFFDFSKMW